VSNPLGGNGTYDFSTVPRWIVFDTFTDNHLAE